METTLQQRSNADAYIRAIRNTAKRQYAIAYRYFLTDGTNEEPDRGKLSYMAAQAVRLELTSIFHAQLAPR